jgi:hypothetical protein
MVVAELRAMHPRLIQAPLACTNLPAEIAAA